MSGLVPNYQDVVLHNFADVGLPPLACHVFAICALRLPDATVQRIKHFARFSVPPSGRVASSSDSVVPAGYAGSHGRQSQPPSRSSTDSLDARLSDIVDAVLLVAVRVNELAAEEVSHRRVLPLLKFLVATCLASAVDGAVLRYAFSRSNVLRCTHSDIIDDTWIAMPKLPPAMAEVARFAQKYSQIPLLVALPLEHPELSHVIPGNPVRPVSDEGSNLDASSTTSSTPSNSDLAKWLAKNQAKPPTIQYECDDGPPAPLHDGMHRSIFAAAPPAHLLAALVVDHCDRIYSSMSSALYQRRAWNISTPVVGLSFSYDSTMVRVLVGWLGGRATDDGHLPQVHILHAPTSTCSHVAQGIFCLADPVHALCLARLLISCKDSFEEDQRKSKVVEQTPDLRWRADQEPDVVQTDSMWSYEAVRRWCSGVETPESPLASSPTVSPLASSPAVSSDRDEDESEFSPSTNAVIRTYSFEQYIGLKETRGLRPPAVGMWLLDRYVGYHSLPPISAYSDPRTQPLLSFDSVSPHLPFFETYRSATRFRWPHAWKSPDRLPAVPAFLHTLKQELFQASEAQCQTLEPHEQHIKAEALVNTEITSVLEQCLPTILQVCALARSLNLSSTSQRYRYCYDMFFGISAAQNGVSYHSNACLRLSRSTYVDGLIRLSGNELSSYSSSIHERQALSQSVEQRLFAGADKEFRRRLTSARLRFTTELGWNTAHKDPLRRAREAPVVGTCDHVLVLGQPPGRLARGGQWPSILTDTPHSSSPDFPVPLLPSWTSRDMRDGDIASYNILTTVHHDYPGMPDARFATKEPADHLSSFQCRIRGHTPVNPELKVPLLVVVHGVQRIRFNVAESSRLRLCLISSVHFLASLLVFDFPVFGLLTEGTICAVVMAWATRIDGHTYDPEFHLMESNCNAYDISVPAGAFNLATFLLWLEVEHAPRLSEVLNRAQSLASVPSDINPQGFPSGWAMDDQLRDIERHWDVLSNHMKKEEEEEDQEDEYSHD